MIQNTQGSQKFPFDRLLRAVDGLIEEGIIQEEVYAQSGASTYQPKHFACKPFMDREELLAQIDRSSAVITHGGTGIIVTAIKRGKKVIAVPRLARCGEHVDDHQIQLIRQFDEQKLIIPCYELEDLGDKIAQLADFPFQPYRSNTQAILDDLTNYLQSLM